MIERGEPDQATKGEAALTAAAYAVNADDARELLDALGLLEDLATNREAARKARQARSS